MIVQSHSGNHFIVAAGRLALCLIVFGCASAREAEAVTAEKFFKPPKKAPVRSTAGGVYPFGDQMALGLYSISGKSSANPAMTYLARAAQSGFNLAGPYYGTNWQNFSPIYAANSEGMKFTYQIRQPASLNGIAIDQRASVLDKLTDAQMAASVREQITAVLNDPIARDTVVRWALGPEELRYWVPAEMRYLKVASQAIRDAEAALGVAHRPMWAYEPGNRNESALKKTGKYQDITSKGIYLTKIPRGFERSGYAIWSYDQIASAAKSLNTTPQAVLSMYEDFTDPKTGTNPTEIRRVLRHDAYLGLVMGMKGFNIYSLVNRPGLTTLDTQFESYASVAEELTGDLNLQDVFLFGEQRSDLKIKAISGVKEFKYTDPTGKKNTLDSLHYLNMALGSDRYLFLVNSLETPMTVNISGLPSSYMMDDLFAGTTSAKSQTMLNHWLEPLGVAAFRLRPFVAAPILRLAGAGAMAAVPEPSSVILVLAGIFWLGAIRSPRRS
jgi:hypothetical protein